MKTVKENSQLQQVYLITIYDYFDIKDTLQKNFATLTQETPNILTHNRIVNVGYDYQYQLAFFELDSAEIIFIDMPIQEYHNLFSDLSENIL